MIRGPRGLMYLIKIFPCTNISFLVNDSPFSKFGKGVFWVCSCSDGVQVLQKSSVR